MCYTYFVLHIFCDFFSEVIFTDIRIGDTLQMKKAHPCGSKTFLVLRSGIDFKLKCEGCGHEVMVPRVKAEKNIKQVIRENGN